MKNKFERKRKLDEPTHGTYITKKVFNNGILKIDCNGFDKTISIRRMKPFHKWQLKTIRHEVMRKFSRSFNHGRIYHTVELYEYTNIRKCELILVHSKLVLEFEISISLRMRNGDSRIIIVIKVKELSNN